MGISESHSQFAFRIEPKPGGGWVSTSDNPALVFEGATQDEVQQKALEKIGEMAGPEIAAAIKDLEKPGAAPVAGATKFSVSINKKRSISGNIKLTDADSPSSSGQLTSAESAFAQSSPGGLSSTVKFLIVIAVLIIIFLLAYRR